MAHHLHSQLTNLGDGQVHFIQIPSSLLSVHSFQEGQLVTLPARLGTQRPVTYLGPGGGGCVICSGSLPPRITRGGRRPEEMFVKTCQLLRVAWSEIQNDWDFGRGDKLPFCMICIESLKSLVTLHEQLMVLQKKVEDGTENIRNKIRQTVAKGVLSDMRTATFRSKALAEASPCSSGGLKTTSSTIHQGILADVTAGAGGNTISDFSCIFTPTLSGFQQQPTVTGLVIQQESLSRPHQFSASVSSSEPQLTTYSTVIPVSTSHTSDFATAHTIFETQIESEVNTVVSAMSSNNHEEFSNEPENLYAENYDDCSNSEAKSETEFESGASCGKRNDLERKPGKSASRKRPGAAAKSTRKSVATGSTSNSKTRANAGRQNAEHFSPVQTDEQGRLVFEGITITTGKDGYICGQCGASCGKGHNTGAMRKIKIHIKGFHLGAYKCTICNKNFTSNDILSQHITRTHEERDASCDICGKPVKPRYLNHHKFTHMNTEEKEKAVASGFKHQSNRVLERKYMCNTCGSMFKKRSVLQRHEATHKDPSLRRDYKCSVGTCTKSYTTYQALRDHRILHHETGNMRKALCKLCGKLTYPKYLKKHMKIHIAKEERPFVCRICGRRLGNLKTLKLHEAAHDPSHKPEMFTFECDICGQRFVTFKRMRQHRRNIHPNHWKLAVPSNLIDEVSVDKPGEETFIDDLNNEELQEVGNNGLFSYHLYEVRKLDNPIRYECCTCLKEFIGEGDDIEDEIKTHVRLEHIGNFRCNICTKRMKNINEVLAHKRREHMNKLDISCDICGRPGLAAKSIKPHEWSHKSPNDMADAINAGEKVPNRYDKCLNQRHEFLYENGVKLEFTCALCETVFDKLESMYLHRREAHPDAAVVTTKRQINPKKRGRKRKHPIGECECPECGKTFVEGIRLARHIQRVHESKPTRGKGRPRKADARFDDANAETENEETVIKEEPSDSPDSLDSDSEIDEEDYENESQSDPEFKAATKLHFVTPGPSVTLRNRGSLRPRKATCYRYDDDDATDDVQVKINRLQIPPNSGTFRIRNDNIVEYITPEGERNEVLLTEQDIKQSPHTSDVEEYTSNDDYDDDEEDEYS